MEKKAILAGVGGANIEDFIQSLKQEGIIVEGIFDNYKTADRIDTLTVLREADLQKQPHIYEVIVLPCGLNATFEIIKQMRRLGVSYKLFDKNSGFHHTLHIYGTMPHLTYEWLNAPSKNEPNYRLMEKMYKKMFSIYGDDFAQKNIDIYSYIEDFPQEAYRMAEIYDIPQIFCCCTTYPISDRVVPVPNYCSDFGEGVMPMMPSKKELFDAASKKWINSKAVFVGDMQTAPDDLRYMLLWLGEKYPEQLYIAESNGYWSGDKDKSMVMPMICLAEYKYLIDIRGMSFFTRRNNLLQMGRVVLQVESIYRDWYEEDIHPFRDYVPIKPDLSDLLEKIEWLESNPREYERISRNAKEFCETHFTANAYLEYLRNTVMESL